MDNKYLNWVHKLCFAAETSVLNWFICNKCHAVVFALTIVLQQKPVQSDFWVMLVNVKFWNKHFDYDNETLHTCVQLHCIYDSTNQ